MGQKIFNCSGTGVSTKISVDAFATNLKITPGTGATGQYTFEIRPDGEAAVQKTGLNNLLFNLDHANAGIYTVTFKSGHTPVMATITW